MDSSSRGERTVLELEEARENRDKPPFHHSEFMQDNTEAGDVLQFPLLRAFERSHGNLFHLPQVIDILNTMNERLETRPINARTLYEAALRQYTNDQTGEPLAQKAVELNLPLSVFTRYEPAGESHLAGRSYWLGMVDEQYGHIISESEVPMGIVYDDGNFLLVCTGIVPADIAIIVRAHTRLKRITTAFTELP